MPTNGSVAPACPIVKSQLWPDPTRKNIGPIRRTADPAINQIADTVEKILDTTWKESGRNTQRVRIHNPDDYNQWVEVERITRIVFENPDTGSTFEWKYRP